MSRLIDADALRAAVMKILNNSIGGAYDGVYQCLEAINNAPTVEYPEQITVECDTEEDKQKLLSALRNARVTRVVEEERPQGEWEKPFLHSDGRWYHKCTNCHVCSEVSILQDKYCSFCVNCGADTRGGVEK